jgi:Tfp pilus assembly protein PilF
VHADAALAKAAAIDPGNVPVRVGMTYLRFAARHDWAAAEREYRAVMHDPEVLRTVQFHPISLFFVAIGRPDEAVTMAERALVVDPGNLESRAMLGNFLVQAGRLDDALRVYDAFAAEVPGDPRPLFGAAHVHKRRGDFARAAEMRSKAHALDGDEEASRVFARVTTEDEYARAEVTVARVQLRQLQDLAKERYVDESAVAADLKKAKVESLLKLEGHRATKVQTLDELTTIVASGRFDVILTANSDSASVQRIVQTAPDAATVVGVDDLVKNRTLLQAIDTAVLQRDQNLKTRTS